MNWIILIALSIFSLLPSDQTYSTIDLHIHDAKSDKGVVRILVFDSPVGFPDQLELAVKTLTLPLIQKNVKIQIPGLPEGRYAISVFHDEDENGKINTSPVGYPTEKYGFSNNVTGYFGPPSFQKASFILEKGTKLISIKLR
jgi:uncharacterized protein (DUF2141 family)